MGEYGLTLNSHVRCISPVDFNQLSYNQCSLSTEVSPPRKMQDESLLEKYAATKQAQQLPTANHENGLNNSDQIIRNDDSVLRKGPTDGSSPISEDKKNELLNTVSPLQLGLSEPPATVVTSHSSAPPNYWSSPTADETFLQGFQSLNGTVTFQQFPPAPNAVFNAGVSPHMGLTNAVPQHPPNVIPRRAITAHHNFPQNRQQPNAIINNSKSYPAWSSAPQQSSWSGQNNQQTTLSPWGSVVQQQRKSMPNMNPVAPIKKPNFPHHINPSVFSPSKFRRSTSFPGQIHHAALNKSNLDYTGADDNHRENIVAFQVG